MLYLALTRLFSLYGKAFDVLVSGKHLKKEVQDPHALLTGTNWMNGQSGRGRQ